MLVNLTSCPPPPPNLREQRPCQNYTRCCFRNFWKRGIRRFLFVVVREDAVFAVI